MISEHASRIWSQMTPGFLARIVSFDLGTGDISWLPRWPDLFSPGRIGKEAMCAGWNGRYAGQPAFRVINNKGYRQGRIFGRTISAHRIIWFLHSGHWPELIDHINRDRLDNRLANLRTADHITNSRNSAKYNSSDNSDVGIEHTVAGTWQASVWPQGKVIQLGTWDTRAEAVAARNAARLIAARIKPEYRVLTLGAEIPEALESPAAAPLAVAPVATAQPCAGVLAAGDCSSHDAGDTHA